MLWMNLHHLQQPSCENLGPPPPPSHRVSSWLPGTAAPVPEHGQLHSSTFPFASSTSGPAWHLLCHHTWE